MPTALLIDDNLLMPDFVHLAVPDWHILYAVTGRRGLALLREHHDSIDVIVLDIGLPGMDGRLVAARIRTLAPTLPIVPFTGNALADDELREMGCEPAVLKSSHPQALAEALGMALGRIVTPPPPTALLEFVQEYAAQLEQSENRGLAQADLPAESLPAPGTQIDDLDPQLVRHQIARAPSQRQDRILAVIRRQRSCSTAQLAELLGETLRTIQRDLRALTDAGTIEAIGATHNRRYRLQEQRTKN